MPRTRSLNKPCEPKATTATPPLPSAPSAPSRNVKTPSAAPPPLAHIRHYHAPTEEAATAGDPRRQPPAVVPLLPVYAAGTALHRRHHAVSTMLPHCCHLATATVAHDRTHLLPPPDKKCRYHHLSQLPSTARTCGHYGPPKSPPLLRTVPVNRLKLVPLPSVSVVNKCQHLLPLPPAVVTAPSRHRPCHTVATSPLSLPSVVAASGPDKLPSSPSKGASLAHHRRCHIVATAPQLPSAIADANARTVRHHAADFGGQHVDIGSSDHCGRGLVDTAVVAIVIVMGVATDTATTPAAPTAA